MSIGSNLKRVAPVALFILAATALQVCAAQGPSHQAATGAPTVVCFGDSITYRGYPKPLGELLKVNTINAGVGGENTRGALGRLKKDVLDRKPDAVVILFGTNDSRLDSTNAHVTIPQFVANLGEIVNRCQDGGAKVVLCTLPPIDEAKYFTRHKKPPYEAAGGLAAVIAQYRAATLQVAKAQSAAVVDLNQLLDKDTSWRSGDGVHPTDAGNILIAKLIAKVLGPLVRAPASTTRPAKSDISYGPHAHQLLDVYLPARGAGPWPVLIWFGNLWAPGKHVPDLHRFLPAECAVVSVEMRVMGEGVAEKINPPVSVCLLDGRRAVQFVRLHAAEWNLDPNRIAVAGGSQGTLPALYVGCAGEQADPKSSDPVERVSMKVVCVGAFRSQPSIDPKVMQEWSPGVQWGAPAFGCSFAESLRRRDELLPIIKKWSPDALLHAGDPPVYFQYNWGLTRPDSVKEMDYLVHSPRWGLGFQKVAKAKGVVCYVQFPGHPSEKYSDIWQFLLEQLGAKAPG